jgi:CRP/FNR family transcriptional regulator, nitrogen oxide reductase regulator
LNQQDFAGFSLLADLSAGEYQQVISAAAERRFLSGQALFVEGSPARDVLIARSGLVKLSQLGEDGSESILHIFKTGDIVSLGTGMHAASAHSLTDCTALAWDSATFERLTDLIPILQRNLRRILAQRLAELESRFREISTQKTSARVARQLLRLTRVGLPVSGGVDVGLSREEIAVMTATTAPTLSRLIAAWERTGIVGSNKRGGLVVLHPDKLAELAASSAQIGDEQRSAAAGGCQRLPVRRTWPRNIPALKKPAAEMKARLSRRETEVLSLAAEGKSSKQIAAELGSAENTVKKQLLTVYERLHANNRAHAIYLAVRNNLLDPSVWPSNRAQ